MKKVIGITGSIGSGKSYAVNMFKNICKKNKIDAVFINVDDVRRNILKQENIDRDDLNRKIYNNEKEMEKYKQFINPKIREYLIKQINVNNCFIFIEWALLIEDEFEDIVDSIIMIDCKREIQIERLEKGDLGKEEVIKRINLQLTNNQKKEKIKNINKETFIIDTTNNPESDVYEEVFYIIEKAYSNLAKI